jgi:hypothetical protein
VVWNLLPRLTMRLNLLAIIDMLSTTSDIITVTGPNTLGVVYCALGGFSSEASNMRGVVFGTLRNLYFQQNTSPYISHDTGTIMTPNDNEGIENRSRAFTVL